MVYHNGVIVAYDRKKREGVIELVGGTRVPFKYTSIGLSLQMLADFDEVNLVGQAIECFVARYDGVLVLHHIHILGFRQTLTGLHTDQAFGYIVAYHQRQYDGLVLIGNSFLSGAWEVYAHLYDGIPGKFRFDKQPRRKEVNIKVIDIGKVDVFTDVWVARLSEPQLVEFRPMLFQPYNKQLRVAAYHIQLMSEETRSYLETVAMQLVSGRV